MPAQRFPILFSRPNKLLSILGIPPGRSYVEIDDAELRVRLSWAFRSTVARSALGTAAPYAGRVFGWGAHGWRGRWLVNGSSKNIVLVPIDPPGRATVCFWPVQLRELAVSVEDPDGLIALLNG